MGNECSCNPKRGEEDNKNQIDASAEKSPTVEQTAQVLSNNKTQSSEKNLSPPDDIEELEEVVCDQKEEQIEEKEEENKEQKKQVKRVRIIFHVDDTEQKQSEDNVSILTTNIKKSDEKDILKCLDKHFIMSQLSQEEKKSIIYEMEYCTASKNTYIFRKGDPSFSFYIILSGKCGVQIDSSIRKEITQGQSFGDLGILYNAPRSASIFVVEDCLLVRLSRVTFRGTLEKLNEKMEQQNKKTLEVLQFYHQLNEEQKNALAANSTTEVYSEGQVIFNKGDDSNSFYIIQQGQVLITDKKVVLKQGESFGLNSILEDETTIRSSTLIAKKRCKLLSITKQIVKKNLGDNIASITKKNLAFKLIKQSPLINIFSLETVKQIVESIKFEKCSKNDIVIKKDRKFEKGVIGIVLNTDLVSEKKTYIANSIVECEHLARGEKIIFDSNFVAGNDGYFGVGHFPIVKGKTLKKFRNKNSKEGKNENDLQMKDFIVVRRLQAGNFGQVYATYNTKTNQKYAIKVMDKIYMEKKRYLKFIMRENQILSSLPAHPFLPRYYTMFETTYLIAIVMQLIEGQDFFDAMSSRVPIVEQQAVFYIGQILLAIETLHSKKIIYRDLKPENLMLGLDGYLKLIDMGTAKRLTIEDRFRTKTIIGTPHYMAPEIITGKGYTFSSDLWGLGVIMYELIFGHLPFGEHFEDPFKIYKEMISKPLHLANNNKNEETINLLKRLLKKSPQEREGNGIDEIMRHRYFQNIDWKSLLAKQIRPFYYPSHKKQITFEQITRSIQKNKNALRIFMAQREKRKSQS